MLGLEKKATPKPLRYRFRSWKHMTRRTRSAAQSGAGNICRAQFFPPRTDSEVARTIHAEAIPLCYQFWSWKSNSRRFRSGTDSGVGRASHDASAINPGVGASSRGFRSATDAGVGIKNYADSAA